jgi:hypothetical protein
MMYVCIAPAVRVGDGEGAPFVLHAALPLPMPPVAPRAAAAATLISSASLCTCACRNATSVIRMGNTETVPVMWCRVMLLLLLPLLPRSNTVATVLFLHACI